MSKLSGWGRFPQIKARELTPQSESELVDILQQNDSYIPRGNGRSYGDSAINKNLTITMTRMNKFLQWNQESGELVAESGVLIADILIFCQEGGFRMFLQGLSLSLWVEPLRVMCMVRIIIKMVHLVTLLTG